MIGQIRGILIEKKPPSLMIDVHGLGYLLQAPLSTFWVLPEVGEMVVLRTHYIVREDAHLLYGFSTQEERHLFQDIIKVNGVGPKIALALLSGMSPAELIEALQTQSVERLQRIPGIGAKTAQRILVEMQGGTKSYIHAYDSLVLSSAKTPAKQEAIMALVALGYKSQEATRAVSQVTGDDLRCEYIIKEALQGLAKA